MQAAGLKFGAKLPILLHPDRPEPLFWIRPEPELEQSNPAGTGIILKIRPEPESNKIRPEPEPEFWLQL